MLNLALGILFVGSLFLVRRKMGPFRFMNALRRVVGLWFVSLGSLAVIVTVAASIWPDAFGEAVPFNRVLVSVLAFGFAVVLGIWFLRAPTYRPDLGDTMRLMSTEPWPEELERRKGRTWWTGDPRVRSTEPLATDARTI